MSDLAMLDNLLINISSEMDCSYNWGGRRRMGWDRLCAPGCGQACGLSLPLLVGIVLFAYSFNEAFRLSQHSVHQTEQLIRSCMSGFLIIWMVPSSHALYVSKSACL